MLIPSAAHMINAARTSLSRRVNANSQPTLDNMIEALKLIKKGEC